MSAAAERITPAAVRLLDLARRLESQADFVEVLRSLREGHGATLDGVWGSSCALVAAAIAEHAPGPLVIVCPHPGEVDDLVDDLALFSRRPKLMFPAWESLPDDDAAVDEVGGDRLHVLKQLAAWPTLSQGDRPILLTSIQALTHPVPPSATIARHTRRLSRGDESPLEKLVEWLLGQGFQNTTAVELPGEFSVRGGILDLFAPDWDHPVRVEFFGDQIESLRSFEPATQRSLAPVDSVEVTLLDRRLQERAHFAEHLPPGSWFLLVEPHDLEEEAKQYLARLDDARQCFTAPEVFESIYRFPSATAAAVARGSMETTCQLKIESVERFSGDIAKVRQELDSAGQGQEVFVVCQTEAEARRLTDVFATTQLAASGKLHFPLGRLRAGFRLVSDRLVLVGGGELFHREDVNRPTQRRRLGRVLDSFLDLREGDYVVHLSHGIGKYRGLKLLETPSQTEEHLEVEFHGGTKIFVPITKIGLVQKYVGGTKTKPTLAHIGGKTWVKQKAAAERAVVDMAAEMLEMQAARGARPGIQFRVDTEWQQEFDASFPYNETPDQLTAIAAMTLDMGATRPMDRLICGDVGYGKTEVAMRAAFKAIDNGYQVAVLVPTTILAMQHLRTFTQRMAEFPFQIGALSRFCSAKEEKQVLAGIADGSVDIVIGTHRLAQGDVNFQNLGLIVIDEEQRFGVQIKERLKTYRHIVDVLTLSATPIPRTLHMSLLGLRDISNLETPPADRLAVETRVTRSSPELIRHAVLRELNRGGQIFFVHNRINDIHVLYERLRQIVPECRIAIGHGQMPEGKLEDVMLDFVAHRFDMLLATTIVESGLDIPNANTIFIDESDRYGLADLHQLRGRVGRFKHRAYCYLLLDPNKHLTPNAAKRMMAIEEFSEMGAGFAIAMRDLEIRGAGNILGVEQSGHIATIGYELYCELLENAVRRLKQMAPRVTVDVHLELPGEAYLPRTYVPNHRLKIDLYRRLARVSELGELNDLRAEILDRFGPLPATVERLLGFTELRILAHQWQIASIHLEDPHGVLEYTSREAVDRLRRATGGRIRPVDGRSAYVTLKSPLADADRVIAELQSLLRRQS
ncbi:MAG: transcription-repair coupling factor [Planctomycetia bacterium]|nr:transcription-repair coupling factor [Planctomycetia bacterium]